MDQEIVLVTPQTQPTSRPSYTLHVKVPKRENCSLAFFALREPIWACDLGTGEKIEFFYQLTPDFDGFWFFAA
jgi:hypothetical protein